MSVMLRPLAATDSLQELTGLLHKAYAALGAQGWNFTAVDQSVELTAKRVAGGGCLVAVDEGGRLVGTVNMRGPYRPDQDAWSLATPWYLREDTAILSQFAVEPSCQGQGLGARLMDAAEAWAAVRGYLHVALDTAEPAVQLQRRYAQRGYRTVGRTQWEGKTYASVLMVRPLPHTALRAALLRMAHYELWATRRLLKGVDGLSCEQYRQDAGLFFKSVHGTLNHLLVGQLLLWQPRFADGSSPVIALNAEAEPDRARLRQRLLDGAARWPAVIGVLDETRLCEGALDYRTSQGAPASVPMAACLQHVFNHGTHHRGQVTAALTALGQVGPELDLMHMLREWPQPKETSTP